MTTDQGSQFTSFAWTDRLKRAGCRISMEGRGRCIDNVFIEGLWRSLKYDCVYLGVSKTGSGARAASETGSPSTTTTARSPSLAAPPTAVFYPPASAETKPTSRCKK